MKDCVLNKKTSGWLDVKEDEKYNIFSFCDRYIKFLNKHKTERETSSYIVDKLKENGFKDINTMDNLKTGDKVYLNNRFKTVYAAVIGNEDMSSGINIIGSHIDSPRLDLKPSPLYEDCKLALLKTHYYGGIKKYQWTTIPLSMHGVIVKPNGDKIEINIGEKDDDPIFTITDILPHLAIEQYEKKIGKAIDGEALNVLVGSIPTSDTSVKENIMNLISQKYDIKEIDFYSSELEMVPAFQAKSLGFDKSMIAGYGQDDRVCAFTSLEALLEADNKDKTIVSIFADKEEIGSYGNTGMCSETFDLFINEILNKQNANEPGKILKIYNNSDMLSADVGAGVDPNFENPFEKNNSSFIGYGVELNKYTGSGGKSGASDANAEFVGKIRNILEKNNIKYHVSELGKVDVGGGGTIAYILANKGMNVIDCGVPVISMHSPYEVTSKYDVYSVYLAYKAFYNES